MKFKQGDTFDFSGAVNMVDGAGDPIDMTDWTVASSVLLKSGETVPLTASWVGGGFTHVRLQHDDTADWPVGAAKIDVQFTSPSDVVVSTPTVTFSVVGDIT